MEKIVIRGGKPLKGEIEVSGMKNAALPILFATLLTEDRCVIENLPCIDDVTLTLEILRCMGASVRMLGMNTVEINTKNAKGGTSPADLVRRMRASYYLLGAELGRYGRAKVGFPGGCNFGTRPIDQHIKSFESLGATVDLSNGNIAVSAPSGGLHSASIFFDKNTVGGTMNAILAAVKVPGLTVIENAAREPHIVDLANFLNTCGAKITGAGTDTIKVRGVDRLRGCTYAIIPDMIEAGTYMIAAAATKGDLLIKNVIPKHLDSISAKLSEMGIDVVDGDDTIRVRYVGKLQKCNVKAMPYPSFPTDMQPQMCVLLALAEGSSILIDGVYDNRFKYVDELRKMGANITVEGKTAFIEGIGAFRAAPITAVDLRAGAAMVIAALATEGECEIDGIHHIERGYDDITGKLRGAGADICKKYFDDSNENAV